MAKSQSSPIAPPSQEDLDNLLDDYTSILQANLLELFEGSHDHAVLSADPSSNQGEVGDIALVNDGSTRYIAVKFSDGWFKTSALTAI